jgi:transcriptional regulator with XRE-family HTH domain
VITRFFGDTHTVSPILGIWASALCWVAVGRAASNDGSVYLLNGVVHGGRMPAEPEDWSVWLAQVGKRVHEARTRTGLSIESLSIRSGVRVCTLIALASGALAQPARAIRAPRLGVLELFRLAVVLHVSLTDLVIVGESPLDTPAQRCPVPAEARIQVRLKRPGGRRRRVRTTYVEVEFVGALGRRVRLTRLARGLSHKDVVRRSGLPWWLVSLVERGAYPIDLVRLFHLVAAMDGSIDEVIAGPAPTTSESGGGHDDA